MQIVIPTRKTKAKHIIPNQTRPHSKPMTQIATQPWNVRKYHSNTHRQLHQLTATLSIVLADADNNWPQENDSENVLTHDMGSGGTDIIACTAFTKSTATHTHKHNTGVEMLRYARNAVHLPNAVIQNAIFIALVRIASHH